jgi:hypothetical protein
MFITQDLVRSGKPGKDIMTSLSFFLGCLSIRMVQQRQLSILLFDLRRRSVSFNL